MTLKALYIQAKIQISLIFYRYRMGRHKEKILKEYNKVLQLYDTYNNNQKELQGFNRDVLIDLNNTVLQVKNDFDKIKSLS